MPVPLSTLEQYLEERDAGRICDPGGITDSHPSKCPLPLRKWGERSRRLPAKPNLIENSGLVPSRRTCKGPFKARGKGASFTSSARALLPPNKPGIHLAISSALQWPMFVMPGTKSHFYCLKAFTRRLVKGIESLSDLSL